MGKNDNPPEDHIFSVPKPHQNAKIEYVTSVCSIAELAFDCGQVYISNSHDTSSQCWVTIPVQPLFKCRNEYMYMYLKSKINSKTEIQREGSSLTTNGL